MKGGKPYHIVVAEPFDPDAVARLERVGKVSLLGDSAPDTMIEALGEADALLVRSKAHVTARIIEAAPRLKVIGRASPTVDHIDVRAARRRKISIVYAPHAAVNATAEFALALILAAGRRIAKYDRKIREGKFDAARSPGGREMEHQTLGLLGVDPIAEKLGRMCLAAFGSRIIYHDPCDRTPTALEGEGVSLDTLLAESDILSVHLPLSPDTRRLLDAALLAKMKPTSLIINVSRGGVIDTSALAQALKSRQIAGAALDVFEAEPLPGNHPLRQAPNCILTPHVAGSTAEASASRYDVVGDVVRVLEGEQPHHPV